MSADGRSVLVADFRPGEGLGAALTTAQIAGGGFEGLPHAPPAAGGDAVEVEAGGVFLQL